MPISGDGKLQQALIFEYRHQHTLHHTVKQQHQGLQDPWSTIIAIPLQPLSPADTGPPSAATAHNRPSPHAAVAAANAAVLLPPSAPHCCNFLPQVKAEIVKYKVGAPARVGLVAPNDVTIPSGSTGMDPSQTSFFQALAIATKINKGGLEKEAAVEHQQQQHV